MQVILQVADRPVALLPESLPVDQLIGQAVSVQDRGVDPGDEDVLVVGAVEDADPPAFGQAAGSAPEEVVLEIVIGGLFEAEHLAALRVHPGHHMADRPVFAGGVHALKDQQQCPMVGGVMQPLQRAQFLDVFLQLLLVTLVRLIEGFHRRRHCGQVDVASGRYPEI